MALIYAGAPRSYYDATNSNCLSNQGLVSIKDASHQVIVQGVHELYDLEETAVGWKENEERTNRLVLIGKRKLHVS